MIQTRKEFLTIPFSMLNGEYSANAMVLYGIIYKMSASDLNGCYPTNAYFAKLMNVNERTITRILKELIDKKAISIRQDEDNKNLRWIKPLITTEIPFYKNNNNGYDFGDNGGFEEL